MSECEKLLETQLLITFLLHTHRHRVSKVTVSTFNSVLIC